MKKDLFKMALLSNYTAELIGKALQAECGKAGLEASVYVAPFKQYHQEIIDSSSGFRSFRPDLTFLLLDGRALYPKWFEFSALNEIDEAERENQVCNIFERMKALIQAIHSDSDTKIVVNNFKIPYHVPFGILDNRSAMGLKRMINTLNLKLENFAAETNYAYVFDYNGFCAYMGHGRTEAGKLDYLVNCPLSYPAVKQLSREYMRYVLPLTSLNKKCLVLDLDHTLWGGVAAEDGISGIRLDISGPGRSFYDFQKEILNLYQKGILLAVNSKNNPEDALDIMENHPHMLLRKRFFSSLKINWQNKAANISEIAAELNIGPDSLVFFDDSPVEREFVKSVLPQVTVIDVPEDPARYCDALKNAPFFETMQITAEDVKRNEMLEQERERKQSMESFQNLEEYLAGLETVMTVLPADEFNIPRISQLTLKTNQFNMTTKRYQVSDIKRFVESGSYAVYCCSVSDRFGDSGITGCCIARLEGETAYLDTFLLSCRILGRNAEYVFLASVLKLLRGLNVKKIIAEYKPTAKNKVNGDFYKKAGFTAVSSDSAGTLYELGEGAATVEFDYIKVLFGKEEDGCG